MGNEQKKSATRNNRNICLPFSQENYEPIITEPIAFRKYIDDFIYRFPELFPPGISNGYQMKDIYCSKKQNVLIRRIEIDGVAYTIRPSFILPYMTGLTDNAEKALFLRKFNVPFWALSYVFGKDPSYWYLGFE